MPHPKGAAIPQIKSVIFRTFQSEFLSVRILKLYIIIYTLSIGGIHNNFCLGRQLFIIRVYKGKQA